MIVTHSFGLLDLCVLTNEFTLIRWWHCLTMVFEFSCEVLWAHRCVNKLMLFTSQITLVSILAVIISFGHGFSWHRSLYETITICLSDHGVMMLFDGFSKLFMLSGQTLRRHHRRIWRRLSSKLCGAQQAIRHHYIDVAALIQCILLCHLEWLSMRYSISLEQGLWHGISSRMACSCLVMLNTLFLRRTFLHDLEFVLRFIVMSRGWCSQVHLVRSLSSDGHLNLTTNLAERAILLEILLRAVTAD